MQSSIGGQFLRSAARGHLPRTRLVRRAKVVSGIKRTPVRKEKNALFRLFEGRK